MKLLNLLLILTITTWMIIPTTAFAQLADSPWPMFHGDVRHTGLSKYDTSHVDGTLKWTFEAGEGIESSPAIGTDGAIYFGAHDNKFYAVNPDGTLKWKYESGSAGFGNYAAIGADGTIYAAGGDWDEVKKSFTSVVFAFDSDGKVKWKFRPDAVVEGSPTIANDGTIYIGTKNGKFYALSPRGKELWRFDVKKGRDPRIFESYPGKETISSSAAISADGTIYFGDVIDTFYALDLNGKEKWRHTNNKAGGHSASPAIAQDGTVYAATVGGKVLAFGKSKASKDSIEYFAATIAILAIIAVLYIFLRRKKPDIR